MSILMISPSLICVAVGATGAVAECTSCLSKLVLQLVACTLGSWLLMCSFWSIF